MTGCRDQDEKMGMMMEMCERGLNAMAVTEQMRDGGVEGVEERAIRTSEPIVDVYGRGRWLRVVGIRGKGRCRGGSWFRGSSGGARTGQGGRWERESEREQSSRLS